jgi:hypothetical protein
MKSSGVAVRAPAEFRRRKAVGSYQVIEVIDVLAQYKYFGSIHPYVVR